MKFMALFHLKADVNQAKIAEAIARRVEYKFPEGVELLEEYWTPVGSPAVVSIFEATSPAALMANSVTWIDTFDVHVYPITEWKEGAQKLPKLLARK